ncbi:adenylate/guanylate cyclase domain-containing protein [Bowdeniella massiliensis]|uniref:adenylate/guanylate cyclase domain-containing protein n=1 Tax=Bowdeniella massiliensis TaxID=2932264 RepID=UPI002029670A
MTSKNLDTVEYHVNRLLGGAPSLTITEVAERVGVDVSFVRTFWRAMGFATVTESDVVFTEADVQAVRTWRELLARGRVDERTAVSLLRAESHITDRLVLWQVEALIDDVARRLNLDDTSARLVVLDHISDDFELLSEQLAYSWRRQLAALATRINAEVAQRSADDDLSKLPLKRALGFVDMVEYTRRSRTLDVTQLTELIQGFEFIARDVITSEGGRIVKTIGDAVLYIADDLDTGARIVLSLIEALKADPRLPPVRASLVQGRVVSHSGDIFGPVVNVASRLADIALPGTVLMDETTAALLQASETGHEYDLSPRPVVEVQGLGEIRPVELRKKPEYESDD